MNFDPQSQLDTVRNQLGAITLPQGAPQQTHPMGPSNPRQPVEHYQIPSDPVRPWDLSSVRAAIDNMARGFLQDASDLAQYMKRDSAFASAMNKRVLGLLRSDLLITPASSDDLDVEVANAVKACWCHMVSEVELKKFVEWYHLTQFSVANVEWDQWKFDDSGKLWQIPRMVSRLPRWFYWDTSKVCWMDINYSGVNPVDPTNGEYVMVAELKYGYFGGKVSELSEDWIEKVFARRDWAEWRDFNSWPVSKVTIPASGGDEDANVLMVQAQTIQTAARNRTVVVTKDAQGNAVWDWQPVKVGGEEWKVYLEDIEYINRQIQIAWLGGNLPSEVVDQGARAASQTQASAETRLIKSDSAMLGATLRDSIVRFFVNENFGYDVAVPDISWQVSVQEEQAAMAKGYNDFFTALKNLPPNFEIENLSEIAQQFNIRLKQNGPTPAPAPNTSTMDVKKAVSRRIKKIGDNKWRVYSENGKNMGTFTSLAAAKKRLKQIEAFKHKQQ